MVIVERNLLPNCPISLREIIAAEEINVDAFSLDLGSLSTGHKGSMTFAERSYKIVFEALCEHTKL